MSAEEKFQDRYCQLEDWLDADLSHRLAKKLCDRDITSLVANIRRIVTETMLQIILPQRDEQLLGTAYFDILQFASNRTALIGE